ncbi:MAG: hypothetical protein RL572_219 [Pseudomonadota bacterium]|jgi:hypothetical protein
MDDGISAETAGKLRTIASAARGRRSQLTTLNIEQLLPVFLAELIPSVELEGLQDIYQTQQRQIVSGRKASHLCSYRVITTEDKHGQGIFKHSKKSIQKELSTLEILR